MLKIVEFHTTETDDPLYPPSYDNAGTQARYSHSQPLPDYTNGTDRPRVPGQLLRFGIVGSMNTLVDLAILNGLLWLFPTTSTLVLLAYSAFAFSVGAVNSFLFNKYWTFGHRQPTTGKELLRFVLVTGCGIGWSSFMLWIASTVLHPVMINPLLWANASKIVTIVSTALLSYLAMRLWVFVRTPHKGHKPAEVLSHPDNDTVSNAHYSSKISEKETTSGQISSMEKQADSIHNGTPHPMHSISIVLPVYNEEDAITTTIRGILTVLSNDIKDIEIIAVNDGSSDRSAALLAAIAVCTPQVRVITHEQNLGYGAALADGFAAATKELTFFMDADGQFDIHDLSRLLAFVDRYDAVLGYRLERQDTWMRKLNAWGWKTLIGITLGVHVRDIDCAFKVFRTDFLHRYAPETRGAMINAEILYKLTHAGYTYYQVGVHHLPRKAGKATGAQPRVIIRAFQELFIYARKWRYEETNAYTPSPVPHQQKHQDR